MNNNIELAKAEALAIGQSIASSVFDLSGERGFKSAMAEMIPDRMKTWTRLSPVDKKKILAYIKKTVWG